MTAESARDLIGWLLPLLHLGTVVTVLGVCLHSDVVRRRPTWNSAAHLFAVVLTLPTGLLVMWVNPMKDRTLPFFYTSMTVGGLLNAGLLAVALHLLLPALA
ncbi:SCO4225 family membrane protein [Streptomyces sparsus]